AASESRTGVKPYDLEWGRRCSVQSKFVWKRQDVENAKTPADGGFPVLEGVISKPDSGFEILGCRVIGDETIDVDRTARAVETWRDPRRSAIRDRRDLLNPI